MEVIINEDQALQAVLGKYEYFKSLFAHLSYSYAGVDVFVEKEKVAQRLCSTKMRCTFIKTVVNS